MKIENWIGRKWCVKDSRDHESDIKRFFFAKLKIHFFVWVHDFNSFFFRKENVSESRSKKNCKKMTENVTENKIKNTMQRIFGRKKAD